MKVKQAKTAGFCMGVRRAMEMVLAEAHKGDGPIYTYGPLIHNRQVLELLESKGIKTVESLVDLESGTILIRAHGIPPDKRKFLRDSNLKLMDATCPRVARVQAIIRYHTKKGFMAIIAGDKDHAEVIGLMGYGNGHAHVISHAQEVTNLPDAEKVILVAQTTQNTENFEKIKETILERFPETLIFNTICDATHERQEEVRALAKQVDGLVVVGGYHSGNTQRLAQVSKAEGLPTFHVETEKELDRKKLSTMEVVGVTAGASTPNWMIKNVVQEIESIRGRGETTLLRKVKNFFKFLMLSNLAVALGAFFLSFAAALISGRSPDLIYPCLAFLYIYPMHVVNRFLDKEASTYNDPEMADFYSRNRLFLIMTSTASIFGGLALAYHLGPSTLVVIAGLSILGLFYSIPVVPTQHRDFWRYSKIKDIPGSKTLSMALAWGIVIALVPMLGSKASSWPEAVICFLYVFIIAYLRSALFDIFQAQGDLIVGSETLPVVLGEKRTLIFLKWLLLGSGSLFLISTLFGLVGPFSYLLLSCLVYLGLCLFAYKRSWLNMGARFDGLVEGSFFLAGVLSFVWYLFT